MSKGPTGWPMAPGRWTRAAPISSFSTSLGLASWNKRSGTSKVRHNRKQFTWRFSATLTSASFEELAMTDRDRLERQIREALSTETSAAALSEKLFSPTGLFSALAPTEPERQVVV